MKSSALVFAAWIAMAQCSFDAMSMSQSYSYSYSTSFLKPSTINFNWEPKPYEPLTAKNGDKIVFDFPTGEHNVHTLPTKEAFDTCDFSGATLVSEDGPTTVVIKASPGETLYFVCTVGPHCTMGQKLAVEVVIE